MWKSKLLLKSNIKLKLMLKSNMKLKLGQISNTSSCGGLLWWAFGSSLAPLAQWHYSSLVYVTLSCMPKVCQEPSFLNGGTWRTMIVPERRLEGQGHPWCHWWPFLTPRKIPWKFCVDIFIFGWDIRVCYHGNKNVTDRHTNRQTDTEEIYIRYLFF